MQRFHSFFITSKSYFRYKAPTAIDSIFYWCIVGEGNTELKVWIAMLQNNNGFLIKFLNWNNFDCITILISHEKKDA